MDWKELLEKVRAGVDMEEGADEPGQRIKIRNGETGTKPTESTENTGSSFCIL